MVCAVDNTGCYIKIFDALNYTCLYSFKRGIKGCLISNASFDLQNTFLSVASSLGTIHFFPLKPSTSVSTSASPPLDKSSAIVESGKKFFTDLKSYLPDAIGLPKSTAKLHLKESDSCNWTAKESSMVGPMVIFAKEKSKIVF